MKTYVVDAGTKPSTCRGKNCMATIYWTERQGIDKVTKKPKTIRNPIDCQPSAQFPDLHPPTADKGGVGVSHWLTCNDRDKF